MKKIKDKLILTIKKIFPSLIFSLLLSIFLIFPNNTFGNEEYLNDINYKQNIQIGKNFNIDLTNIREELESNFGTKIIIEWNIKGETTKSGDIFNKTFKKIGDKKISLNIYKLYKKEKNLIIEKNIKIFVYKNNILLIKGPSINKNNLTTLIESAKDSGIYISVKNIEKNELIRTNLLEIIKKYKNISNSDYISIWGDRNFLINSLSKLNKEIEISSYKQKLNFSFISSFNIDILRNYLNNFLSNKLWINEIIMIDETSRFQIIKAPKSIKELKNKLINNNYTFLELTPKNDINKLLFISKFINNLSGKGFNTQDIYILLIIPFLLTLISIQKHLIGLSPMGIIIPIFITILLFKIGILVSLIIISTILITNLLLSKVINKYTLLYTPKISFITIINILTMIISINILYSYNLLNINISDGLFIILLIVISERLITIILSKDFIEYKLNLFNTILFALFTYFLLSLNMINTFLLAYPEIILLLIPLNFIIGRFTGLRVTEYFRFREVIKNIEE